MLFDKNITDGLVTDSISDILNNKVVNKMRYKILSSVDLYHSMLGTKVEISQIDSDKFHCKIINTVAGITMHSFDIIFEENSYNIKRFHELCNLTAVSSSDVIKKILAILNNIYINHKIICDDILINDIGNSFKSRKYIIMSAIYKNMVHQDIINNMPNIKVLTVNPKKYKRQRIKELTIKFI